MNSDSTRVPEDASVFLNSCLVEGDPAQQKASTKIRRRAILLSVTLQSLTLAGLIVFPLLSKGERLPIKMFVEPPPYRLGSANPNSGPTGHHESGPSRPCVFCKQSLTPSRPTNNRTNESTNTVTGDDSGIVNTPYGDPNGVPHGFDLPTSVPRRPNRMNSIRNRLPALSSDTSIPLASLTVLSPVILPWAFSFVAKLVSNCKPLLPPTGRFNRSRSFPEIRSSINPPWKLYASGCIPQLFSMAAPLKWTPT